MNNSTDIQAHVEKKINQSNELLSTNKMANGWTAERQQRQAKLIRQWKPWEQSTGAKTTQGKAISSRNAFKGGWRQELKELRKLLKADQKEMDHI